MPRPIILISCLLASAAVATMAARAQPLNKAASASPGDVIASRQVMFDLSAGTFGEMKSAADAGADIAPFAFGARALARWARSIPAMFPPGSTGPTSHARPEIWTDRADFEAKAAAYQAAAEQLGEAAQHGDRAAFLQQWQATLHACSACHDAYRGRAS